MTGELKPLLAHLGPGLERLLQRAAAVDALTAAVRKLLPPEQAAELHTAIARDGELVLVAGSAAWAARLRFHAPTVLSALNARPGEPALARVRVKVRGA